MKTDAELRQEALEFIKKTARAAMEDGDNISWDILWKGVRDSTEKQIDDYIRCQRDMEGKEALIEHGKQVFQSLSPDAQNAVETYILKVYELGGERRG